MKRHMKITYSILGLTAGAALLLTSGCSKPEQSSGEIPKVTPPAASDMQKAAEAAKPATEPAPAAAAATTAASQTASAATSDAQKAVDAQKAAAPPAPPAAAAAAEQAVTAAASQTGAAAALAAAPSAMNSQVEGLIYNAKGLVTNQKYQDALNVVQQLSSLKLTPEQLKVVDGLKAQIQAALAKAAGSDAASALGNVLGGKK